jgi:hypothetical protein
MCCMHSSFSISTWFAQFRVTLEMYDSNTTVFTESDIVSGHPISSVITCSGVDRFEIRCAQGFVPLDLNLLKFWMISSVILYVNGKSFSIVVKKWHSFVHCWSRQVWRSSRSGQNSYIHPIFVFYSPCGIKCERRLIFV